MELMQTPFVNDPFALCWRAFKNLCPDKECVCAWDPQIEIETENGTAYGYTTFCDDGKVVVGVGVGLAVSDTVEILAHELAHVAAGEANEHNEVWEAAFDAINKEYDRLVEELSGE